MQLRYVTDTVSVAPQILPDDLAAIAQAGFVRIVNNRPDGEDAGQPTGDAIRAAALGAGLDYVEIPVTQAGFSMPQIDAMAEALASSGGPVLAYCRSGTRSCNLWALAQASMGEDPQGLVEAAAVAGYDLAALRPLLDQLAARR